MTTEIKTITPKQISFINDLLSKRVVPANLRGITIELLNRAEASDLIGTLLNQPRKISVPTPTPTPVVETPVASAPTSTPAPTFTPARPAYVDRYLIPNTAPTTEIPFGIYTVDLGNGTHVTLKFSKDKYGSSKGVFALLIGPDNELSYQKFGSLTDKGARKFSNARVGERTIAALQFLLTGGVDTAREKFLELAQAHAFKSGNCLACLKTLTVPASVYRGLGPTCARRLGVA
jgi:Family of unknown function (DUF6011)